MGGETQATDLLSLAAWDKNKFCLDGGGGVWVCGRSKDGLVQQANVLWGLTVEAHRHRRSGKIGIPTRQFTTSVGRSGRGRVSRQRFPRFVRILSFPGSCSTTSPR